IGYHEAAGRLLSLAFTLLLGGSIWVLGGRLTADPRARAIVRALALTILLACTVVANYAAAGLTDIPVAATASLTAVFVTSRLGRARVPLVAVAAAATVLAKPSGLLALAGIVLASALFFRDPETRRRAVTGVVGIGLGALVALGYDLYEAHRLGEGLAHF